MTRLRELLFADKTFGAFRRKFDLRDADARLVWTDLASYCNYARTSGCVSPSTGMMDPIAMAYAEGRRDAFLYMMRKANTDTVELEAAIQQEMRNAE